MLKYEFIKNRIEVINKKLVVGIIIFTGLLVLSIPFFLDSNANTNLRVGATLISAVASLTTLIIAIILYDRYGIQKSRIEKQTDTLICFLSLLKDTRLWMHSHESLLQYRPNSNQEAVYERVYAYKLYFDEAYIDYILLYVNHAYDINMPKSVANKIKVLKPGVLSLVDKNNLTTDFFIVTNHNLANRRLMDKAYTYNETELTFLDYHNTWIDIIDEAKKWLTNHQINIDELNIN